VTVHIKAEPVPDKHRPFFAARTLSPERDHHGRAGSVRAFVVNADKHSRFQEKIVLYR